MPETEEGEEQANNQPNWIGIANLVVLTLTLGAVTWYACLTHALLVQGREQFAQEQRAWIVFDPSIAWPTPVAGERYEVELLYRNVGHTIARNIRVYNVALKGPRAALPEHVEITGVPITRLGVMAPGIKYPARNWTAAPLDAESVQLLGHQSSPPLPTEFALRNYGVILYEDAFGVDRGLHLCLEYNPERKRRFSFCETGNEAW